MKRVRLGEIIEYVKGNAFSSKLYKNKGIRVIRITDFSKETIGDDEIICIDESEKYNKYILKKDDILIQTVGSWGNNPNSIVGKFVRVPESCEGTYLNQNIVKIYSKSEYDNRYIYYALKANRFSEYCVIRGQGAANQASITLNTIFKFDFLCHDYFKQLKISKILSKYDDLIENNNKRIEILEKIIEEFYKEWFVRFRFPGYEDCEFFEGVPEKWKYKEINEIIKFYRGISYSSEEIDCEEGLNLINLKNINSYGGFRLDGTKKYNGRYKNYQVVKKGDLVMGVTDMTQDRRTVGAVALIPEYKEISVISADLVKIESKINNVYLYLMFRYGNISKYISQFANGANVLHLKPNVIGRKKIITPPNKIIEKFTQIINPFIEEMNILNEENQKLINQRDLLLPRLMSGKLELK